MKRFRKLLNVALSLVLLVGINAPAIAKVKLATIFTDNMVLQQNSDAPLWGKATPEKKVNVITSWDNQSYQTTSDKDGNWKLSVKTPKAGFTPYSINVSDGEMLTLKNVLIGEVWICSGQSNMEMPLAGWGKIKNYEAEIANANFPSIRLLQASRVTSTVPLENVQLDNQHWKECSPTTISGFSAVAYFFGRDLQKSLNVPIGLINVAWGGTIAEAWTSKQSIVALPDFVNAIPEVDVSNIAEKEKNYKLKFEEWQRSVLSADKGYQNGLPAWSLLKFDDTAWKTMNLPGLWEENGLPNFDGIVWFRKHIKIPKSMKGKELKVSLGEIDDNDVTFFNGVQIGATEGWDKARAYSVPAKLVKEGNAVVSVKVYDPWSTGGIYGDAKKLFVSAPNGTKINLAGDWKYEIGANIKDIPKAPQADYNSPNRPTVLFNAMINPLVPFAMRGAIWYQGESNAFKAYQYRDIFPLMIQDWRKQWKSDFPFYFVQLANFTKVEENPVESDWAELREAQLQALHLENTGMAVTIDIGDAEDVHPKNKQDVGLRLSLLARANTYGEKIVFSGPIFKSYRIKGNKMYITFDYTEGGLKTNDNEALKGFALAGPDRKFYWADAKIVGNEVVVSSSKIAFPVSVRYAWANNPICNLINGVGLPASPFRTDDWVGITAGRK